MRRRCTGFTLPELLIVFSIAAILLAAGVPSFRTYLHRQQVATAASQFLFALNLARSEAIRRADRVAVAPRDGRNWENGWVVFISRDHRLQFNPGDELLYSYDGLAQELRIATTLSDKSYPYIAYNGSGRTRANLSAQPQWGSWRFSLHGQARIVRVTLAGRARLCNPAEDTSCRFAGAQDSL